MPKEGMRWRHVTIGTHNSWLPGDPRGFRTKEHCIHSSGDYRNPPPKGEHAGLHAFSKQISDEPVIIPNDLRAVVGKAIIRKLLEREFQILAIAVAGMHTHFLVELPASLKKVRRIVGDCKSAASHAIREKMPGRVWGRLGSFKLVNDRKHHRNTFDYILKQKDAWIWSYKDPVPED